jgi:hypothetical protein
VSHDLEIERWSFWSPETRDPLAWRDHWINPSSEPAKVKAKAPDDAIPALHRRRMSSLAKAAVQVAIEAAGDVSPDFLVFCSQHGDLTRLREMLRDIAAGVELSPTTFSQSVHNASAGLYTIICKSSAPVSALASGGSTFAAGWLEAEGFLLEHRQARVLLVAFDETLPPEYLRYSTQAQAEYALGLLLRCAPRGGLVLETASPSEAGTLPLAPLFLAWALSKEQSFRTTADGQGWIWHRSTP